MKVLVTQSCLTLCSPWNVARQAPLPMEFSRQKYWSGLPCPSPGDLSDSGTEVGSPALQANSLPPEPQVWQTMSEEFWRPPKLINELLSGLSIRE